MYWLYSVFMLVFVLAKFPYFVYQAVRYGKYIGGLRQRFGYLPLSFNSDERESIWIHAVSVGEVLAARALIPGLRARYPKLRLFVSTTTITGQQVARQDLQGVDEVFYFPFDFMFIVTRVLRLVRPKIFITVDTELWPNLLRACRQRGVRAMLVNGRISSSSYSRCLAVRPFFKRILANVDRFCMQSEESAKRLISLGAPANRVTITGSLKFDALHAGASSQEYVRDRVIRFFQVSDKRQVLIAASTLRGEEASVFRAFNRIKSQESNALLIVAPRHPERFREVEKLASNAEFNVVKRSDLLIDTDPNVDVVVLDTIGELSRLYQVATVVFVGGSLVNAGGHNILEPALFGKPIIFGPHMQNFSEIVDEFLSNGAACQVHSDRELEDVLLSLLGDPIQRSALGSAAQKLVETNRGAKDKSLAVIGDLLPFRSTAELADVI